MIGFAVAGALAGLAVIAWPVCLHFFKIRRKVQEVPSLRLFQDRLRKIRTRLPEDFLLLLARVLACAFLVLMVAQPRLVTRRALPLPEEQPDVQRVLGAMIDDSLSALHARDGTNRLDASRAWLRRKIESRPDLNQIGLAFASSPTFVQVLPLPEALALLDQLTVSSRAGDAAGALKALADRLSGQAGQLVALAPRSGYLWDNLKATRDFPRPLRLQFIDLTDWRSDGILREVDSMPGDPSHPRLLCRLEGAPERLAGRPLIVSNAVGGYSAGLFPRWLRSRAGFRSKSLPRPRPAPGLPCTCSCPSIIPGTIITWRPAMPGAGPWTRP